MAGWMDPARAANHPPKRPARRQRRQRRASRGSCVVAAAAPERCRRNPARPVSWRTHRCGADQAPRLITCTRRLRGSGVSAGVCTSRPSSPRPTACSLAGSTPVFVRDVVNHGGGPSFGECLIVIARTDRIGVAFDAEPIRGEILAGQRAPQFVQRADRIGCQVGRTACEVHRQADRRIYRLVRRGCARRCRNARPLRVAGAVAAGAVVSPDGAASLMPRVPCVRSPLGFSDLMIWSADGLLWARAGRLPKTNGATMIGAISKRTEQILQGRAVLYQSAYRLTHVHSR